MVTALHHSELLLLFLNGTAPPKARKKMVQLVAGALSFFKVRVQGKRFRCGVYSELRLLSLSYRVSTGKHLQSFD